MNQVLINDQLLDIDQLAHQCLDGQRFWLCYYNVLVLLLSFTIIICRREQEVGDELCEQLFLLLAQPVIDELQNDQFELRLRYIVFIFDARFVELEKGG